MRLVPFAATCVVSLCLVVPLMAQDRLETNSGKTYQGKVLSDDGTTVKFETSGGMTLELPYENLTQKTQYRLRRARTADDASAQADLAEWCVEQTLYQEAGRHFRAALAGDASMADELNGRIAKARTTAGKELLERAKSLQEAGRRDDARQILSTIVQELPLEEVTKEATALLADDNAQRKQSTFTRKRKPKKDDSPVPESERVKRKSGADYSDEARATFSPVIKGYYAMLDKTQEGLLNSSQSGSIKDFEKALKDGAKARKAVEKIRPMGEQDEEIAEALVVVDEKLEEALVDCRIHLADTYLMRNSYNQAAEVVNEGLAEYMQNTRLRQAKNRVTAASTSDGDGLIIRRGGLGRR